MINIAITATVRPKLLLQTLNSFYEKCFLDFIKWKKCDDLKIIVNIDPVGDLDNYTPRDVYYICQRFSKNIIYNIPDTPNFAKAVKWCWSQCDCDYIFHLEDDWYLNRKLRLQKMMRYIDKDVSAVRLYKRKYPSEKPYEMFDCEYDFDGRSLFIAKDSSTQFGLNPVLISKKFIKQALPLMVDDINPEKQFRIRNRKMKDLILKHKFGIYGRPGDKAYVKDIGTEWRQKRSIEKPKGESFLTWK